VLAASVVTLLLALSAFAVAGASGNAGTPKSAHSRSEPGAKGTPNTATTIKLPHRFGLTNATVARWAGVYKPALVRARPSDASKVVTRLETRTSDQTQNIVLVLGGVQLAGDQTWYQIRLPILPNNSTGWVRKNALGDLYTVDTHLYVSLSNLTATLKRNGQVVFTTRIGAGTRTNPTPRGQFYVRTKMIGFDSPVYGPLAFGTSARSPTLTYWPGGGFVGIHGTNQPYLLPGYVSHGCIRMPNESILKLNRLMPVGTPITIH
jgi:hypothetical protein